MQTATKRFLSIIMCALILAMPACSKKQDTKAPETTGTPEESTAQLPNPIVDYDTVVDAVKVVNFEADFPEAIGDFAMDAVQVIDGELLQVIYKDGDDKITVRKARGSDDISGDYNTYGETQTLNVNSADITMKGNTGFISLATWTKGDFTYSVHSDSAMLVDEMADIVYYVN